MDRFRTGWPLPRPALNTAAQPRQPRGRGRVRACRRTGCLEWGMLTQVLGQIYPMVGSEVWWLLAGIAFWLAWTVSTANGEAEEQEKLARKKHGPNDYKKNIAEW